MPLSGSSAPTTSTANSVKKPANTQYMDPVSLRQVDLLIPVAYQGHERFAT
jgi:hypothetical protein